MTNDNIKNEVNEFFMDPEDPLPKKGELSTLRLRRREIKKCVEEPEALWAGTMVVMLGQV